MTDPIKNKAANKKKRGITAGSRAAENIKIRQEALRVRIKGGKLITEIGKNLTKYDTLVKQATALKTRTFENQEQTKVDIQKINTVVSIIEKKTKVQMQLLRKVLPDYSLIQVTDSDGNDLVESFMSAVVNGPNS